MQPKIVYSLCYRTPPKQATELYTTIPNTSVLYSTEKTDCATNRCVCLYSTKPKQNTMHQVIKFSLNMTDAFDTIVNPFYSCI